MFIKKTVLIRKNFIKKNVSELIFLGMILLIGNVSQNENIGVISYMVSITTILWLLLKNAFNIKLFKKKKSKLTTIRAISLALIVFAFFIISSSGNTQLFFIQSGIVFTFLLTVGVLIKNGIQRMKIKKLLRSDINEIDKMLGEEFEIFLEALFISKGYKVMRTPTSGDYGADLVIEKGNKKTAVQAKRYSDKVGLSAVQEVVAAMSHYKCDLGMVITNHFFTQQAQKLALSNRIILWNRDELIKEILNSKSS